MDVKKDTIEHHFTVSQSVDRSLDRPGDFLHGSDLPSSLLAKFWIRRVFTWLILTANYPDNAEIDAHFYSLLACT